MVWTFNIFFIFLKCVVTYWIVTALCHRALNYFSYPALSIHSLIIPSLLSTLFSGPSKSLSISSFYELGILAFTFRGTQQLFGVKDINRSLTQRNTFLCRKSEYVLGSSCHWDVSMTIMILPVEPQIAIHSISHCRGDSDWFFPVESTLYLWEWV